MDMEIGKDLYKGSAFRDRSSDGISGCGCDCVDGGSGLDI